MTANDTPTYAHDGRTYIFRQGTWLDADTNLKPPLVIVHALEQRYGRSPGAPAAPTAATPTPAKTTGARSRAAALGRDFTGLTPADFTGRVQGTHWRARANLGGLLAQRLSAVAGRPFITHTVYNRPEVYLGDPARLSTAGATINLPHAKFTFRTAPSGADFGLYIEKSDQPMDGRWEWPRFLAALRDPAHTARLEQAMRYSGDGALGLGITIERFEGGPTGPRTTTGLYLGEQLTRYDAWGDEALTWPALADVLAATDPADWLAVRLHGSLGQSAAIALGAAVVDPAVAVYAALLPLYEQLGVAR